MKVGENSNKLEVAAARWAAPVREAPAARAVTAAPAGLVRLQRGSSANHRADDDDSDDRVAAPCVWLHRGRDVGCVDVHAGAVAHRHEPPREITCSGPKYQHPYVADGIHLEVRGYEMLGEKYGQIYCETVVLGNDWRPLEPTTVERSRRMITVFRQNPDSMG
jgi:hypothetical protein